MKWPLVSLTIKSPAVPNPGEVKAKMEYLFKQLLKLQLPYPLLIPELQMRGGIEDNSKIFFLFLNENICCDPLLEPSL